MKVNVKVKVKVKVKGKGNKVNVKVKDKHVLSVLKNQLKKSVSATMIHFLKNAVHMTMLQSLYRNMKNTQHINHILYNVLDKQKCYNNFVFDNIR